MIRNLLNLGRQAAEAFLSVKEFPEIHLDYDDKKKLSSLSCVDKVFEYSIKLKNKQSNNSIVIPSQFLCYALVMKSFALSLKEFWDAFDECRAQENVVDILKNKDFAKLQLSLDQVSKENAKKFLQSCSILPNKEIKDAPCKAILLQSEGTLSVRGKKDLFSSCILSPINIPNASADSLAVFIYSLCENVGVYNFLEKKYLHLIDFKILHIQNKSDFNVTRALAEGALAFLYQYDGLSSLGIEWKEGEIYIDDFDNEKGRLLFLVEKEDVFVYEKTKKFIKEPILLQDGMYVSLTSEWFERNAGLNPQNLKNWIEKKYPNFRVSIEMSEDGSVQTMDFYSVAPKLSFVQKILFGAPGTGKSHKIDAPESEGGMGLETVGEKFKFRTTFHPDYDYAQFVGSYKPKKDEDDPKRIVYKFVPQVFANAYAAAWNNLSQPVYLVIEEINRGNCAQIFGDLFQLLDRKNGESEYPINADADFGQWLVDEAKIPGHEYDENRCVKIKLPPNFNILATMNTSDQSLFPMDSAFKRRFDWEYVPIDYNQKKAEDFKVQLKKKDEETVVLEFDWLHFLKKINADISKVTESEDKQMGEFFVKPKDGVIGLDMFRSKILFYLWDSVYKDEPDKKNVFHFDYPEKNGSRVTFQSLFGDDANAIEIIKQMMKNLDKAYESKDDSEFKDFKILK